MEAEAPAGLVDLHALVSIRLPKHRARNGNFSGVFVFDWGRFFGKREEDTPMNGIIYLVGLVVVVLLILSFFGLR